MQGRLNDILFDAVFANCQDVSDVDFLADAAEKVGMMNKTQVWFNVKLNQQSR
jgi:predicted DsbA family dithiol-disulfide isomerase